MIRVVDYFINFMAERGVKAAFLLSSGHLMHLLDALGRCPSIKYFCNHHEQASSFAADAYARMTGMPGLCLSGSNGAPNLLTGIVGAYQDSIPMICLTGNVKTADSMWKSGIRGLRQRGVFETDIVSMAKPVTKYAEVVTSADTARLHMERAWHLATSGRPGPVLLDVPLDVQGSMIDPEKLIGHVPQVEMLGSIKGVSYHAEKVIAKIMKASRPLILAGHGIRCAGAVHAFRFLVDRLNVPVVTTQLAKDLLPHDHSLFIGHHGIKGHRAANLAVQRADLILILGSSLHIQSIGWEAGLFAPQAEKIHVDPDAAILEKTEPITSKQIQADVGSFIDAMLDVDYEEKPERILLWNQQCSEWKNRKEPYDLGKPDGPTNLYEVMDILSDLLPNNATIITDSGQQIYIVPQALRLKEGQRYLNPGSLAEMGWALPAAIGAAAADPSRVVVAIIGDGSFQTNIQELQTIRHNNLNIKIIVVNNEGYASIRSTQDRFFDGFHVGTSEESGVSLPKTVRIAGDYEIPNVRAENRSSLRSHLEITLSYPGPMICELICNPNQEVTPFVGSIRQPDGSMKSAPLDEMTPAIEDLVQ